MFKTATLNSYCDEYHHVLVLYPHICLFVSYLITLQVSSLLHWFIHAYRHSGLCGTILHFSVHWLPLLLGDENKVSLLGLGALDPLRQLIAHNNKLVRRNAFMALGIMATSGESGNIWNQWKLLSFFAPYNTTIVTGIFTYRPAFCPSICLAGLWLTLETFWLAKEFNIFVDLHTKEWVVVLNFVSCFYWKVM